MVSRSTCIDADDGWFPCLLPLLVELPILFNWAWYSYHPISLVMQADQSCCCCLLYGFVALVGYSVVLELLETCSLLS